MSYIFCSFLFSQQLIYLPFIVISFYTLIYKQQIENYGKQIDCQLEM